MTYIISCIMLYGYKIIARILVHIKNLLIFVVLSKYNFFSNKCSISLQSYVLHNVYYVYPSCITSIGPWTEPKLFIDFSSYNKVFLETAMHLLCKRSKVFLIARQVLQQVTQRHLNKN